MWGRAAVLLLLATGCDDTPEVVGDATVIVIDSAGRPLQSVAIYSSAGETSLATATTDSTGKATIGVSDVSAVTFYGELNDQTTSPTGKAYVSYTLFGVGPDVAAQLPILFFQGSHQTEYVRVGKGTNDFGAAMDLRVYSALRSGCQVTPMIDMDAALPIDPFCLQSDGAHVVTALLFDAASTPVGYAIKPTTGSGAGTLTLEPIANAAPAPISVDFTNVPEVADGTVETSAYLHRKGQGYGTFASSEGAYQPAININKMLIEPAMADGIYAEMRTASETVARGTEAAGMNKTAMTLDGGIVPLPPSAIEVGITGENPYVIITDPGVTGDSTYIGISWTGPDRVPHHWYAWGPPATAKGPRVFKMPPVPEGATLSGGRPITDYLAPKNVTFSAYGGYNASNPAPTDYLLEPEPYLNYVLRSNQQRAFAAISTP